MVDDVSQPQPSMPPSEPSSSGISSGVSSGRSKKGLWIGIAVVVVIVIIGIFVFRGGGDKSEESKDITVGEEENVSNGDRARVPEPSPPEPTPSAPSGDLTCGNKAPSRMHVKMHEISHFSGDPINIYTEMWIKNDAKDSQTVKIVVVNQNNVKLVRNVIPYSDIVTTYYTRDGSKATDFSFKHDDPFSNKEGGTCSEDDQVTNYFGERFDDFSTGAFLDLDVNVYGADFYGSIETNRAGYDCIEVIRDFTDTLNDTSCYNLENCVMVYNYVGSSLGASLSKIVEITYDDFDDSVFGGVPDCVDTDDPNSDWGFDYTDVLANYNKYEQEIEKVVPE